MHALFYECAPLYTKTGAPFSEKALNPSGQYQTLSYPASTTGSRTALETWFREEWRSYPQLRAKNHIAAGRVIRGGKASRGKNAARCDSSCASTFPITELGLSNRVALARSSCLQSPEKPVANAASVARFSKSPNSQNPQANCANIVLSPGPAAAGSMRQDHKFAVITSVCGKVTGP